MERSSHANSSRGDEATRWSNRSKAQPRRRGEEKKPDEVFRTDLISAMKLPDSRKLRPEEYHLLADPWRSEWEKAVQVPVNPQTVPQPAVRTLAEKPRQVTFTLPETLIGASDSGPRGRVDAWTLANGACRYDLDEEDVVWMQVVNEEFTRTGTPLLDEITMERVMEELETVSSRGHKNHHHNNNNTNNNDDVVDLINTMGGIPFQLHPSDGCSGGHTERSGESSEGLSGLLVDASRPGRGQERNLEPSFSRAASLPVQLWPPPKTTGATLTQGSAKSCRTASHVTTCSRSSDRDMNSILTEEEEDCPKHSGPLQGSSEPRDPGGEEENQMGNRDERRRLREEDVLSSFSVPPGLLPSSRLPSGEPVFLSGRQQEEKRVHLCKPRDALQETLQKPPQEPLQNCSWNPVQEVQDEKRENFCKPQELSQKMWQDCSWTSAQEQKFSQQRENLCKQQEPPQDWNMFSSSSWSFIRELEEDISSSSFAPPGLPSFRRPAGEPVVLRSRQQEERQHYWKKSSYSSCTFVEEVEQDFFHKEKMVKLCKPQKPPQDWKKPCSFVQELEDFWHFVDMEEVARHLKLSQETVDFVFQYWKLKRTANFNQPLLEPKKKGEEEENESLEHSGLQLISQLRYDLERVRNLTCMVTHREKMKRSLWEVQEQIFQHQLRLLDQQLLNGDASSTDALENVFSPLSKPGFQSGFEKSQTKIVCQVGSRPADLTHDFPEPAGEVRILPSAAGNVRAEVCVDSCGVSDVRAFYASFGKP